MMMEAGKCFDADVSTTVSRLRAVRDASSCTLMSLFLGDNILRRLFVHTNFSGRQYFSCKFGHPEISMFARYNPDQHCCKSRRFVLNPWKASLLFNIFGFFAPAIHCDCGQSPSDKLVKCKNCVHCIKLR